MIDDSPSDCCPDPCYKKFPILAGDDDSPFWQGWGNLRLKTFQLIENKYFETAVITMILLSSLALVGAQHVDDSISHVLTKFSQFLNAGSRRRSSAASTNLTRYSLLHGSNIYSDIFLRNVNQMVGARLQSVLHERMVLAGFRHCNGKCCVERLLLHFHIHDTDTTNSQHCNITHNISIIPGIVVEAQKLKLYADRATICFVYTSFIVFIFNISHRNLLNIA